MTTSRVPSRVLGLLTAAFVGLAGVETQAQSVNIAGSVTLTIDSAISVGGGLAPASDGTTYDVTNTLTTKKLVGRLNTAMPTNTTLALQLAAPSGASSSGNVTLTSSNQNLVTGIGDVVQSGLNMTFTLSATVNAGVIASASKTFTLTLVDAP